MTPSEVSPAEVLRKAADVIRQRGWFQGDFFGPGIDGPACLLGGIAVARRSSLNGRAFFELNDYEASRYLDLWSSCIGMVAVAIGDPRVSVGWWNDRPERTADEVIAVLEKAAELAEGK